MRKKQTATHAIPLRHGMTAGELAAMLNTERSMKLRLEASSRSKAGGARCCHDQTGQPWINPSPNMRTPKGTIGVSLLTLQNPFFKVIGDNITAEAAKSGYDTLVVSADSDVARQSNQVKDFIVKKAAAIVLSPADSKAIVPVIQEANAAGIPVFTVDVPCNEPGVKIVTQVATDNFGGGKEAGKAMIEALKGRAGRSACSI
jgi:ABC-type sugar transport system substrate-binding protein